MVQCSKHAIPPAIQADLANRQAHDLELELNAQSKTVLTCRRLGTSLTHQSETVDSH